MAGRRSDDGYGQQEVNRIQELIAAGLTLKESMITIQPMAEAVLAQVAKVDEAVVGDVVVVDLDGDEGPGVVIARSGSWCRAG